MRSIMLHSHVGPDGILKLHVPLDLPDTEVEVMVIVQPLAPTSVPTTPEGLTWPPGFFEQTFGCLQNEPLTREAQGEYEVRDELE